MYVTLIWATREVEILQMFAGQMSCEVLNFGLKRWFKDERPKGKSLRLIWLPRKADPGVSGMSGKGYGMPSSHAQFAAFFAASLSLFLLLRHKPNPAKARAPMTFIQRLLLSILVCLGSSAVAASRVYLNYHTPKQVLVGIGAGVVSALFWFGITTAIRQLGLMDWFLETRISNLVRLRDLVIEEDLADAGWERWRDQRGLKRNMPRGSTQKLE